MRQASAGKFIGLRRRRSHPGISAKLACTSHTLADAWSLPCQQAFARWSPTHWANTPGIGGGAKTCWHDAALGHHPTTVWEMRARATSMTIRSLEPAESPHSPWLGKKAAGPGAGPAASTAVWGEINTAVHESGWEEDQIRIRRNGPVAHHASNSAVYIHRYASWAPRGDPAVSTCRSLPPVPQRNPWRLAEF